MTDAGWTRKCVESVWTGLGNGYGLSQQCGRTGKVQHEGRWYCGMHSPEAKAKRKAKSDAHYQQYREKMDAKYAREDFDRRAGDALRAMNITDPQTLTDSYQQGAADTDGTPLQAKSVDPTLPDLDYPRMEKGENRSSVTSLSVLQGHADAATAMGREVLETWSLRAQRYGTPPLGTYDEGDYAEVNIKNSPRVPDGLHKVRIMSLETKTGQEHVTIQCLPERVAP